MPDISYVNVGGTTYDLNDVSAEAAIATKIPKVSNPTAGHVALVNAAGNVYDSGKSLTAGDIPNVMGFVRSLTASDNLNNIIDLGIYYCGSSEYATTAHNYPIAFAGYLEVFNAGGIIIQRYTAYVSSSSNQLPEVWTRSYYNTWRSWSRAMPTVEDAVSGNVPLLNTNGTVRDSGRAFSPAGIGAPLVSGYISKGVTATVDSTGTSRVRLAVNDPSTGGTGNYMFIASDTGISLFNVGSKETVWSSNQTNVVHKQNKTVTGTTGTTGFLSLGLGTGYGVISVRDTNSTHICIPYFSTAYNGWYAKVLTTGMASANSVAVTLDVDYYLK